MELPSALITLSEYFKKLDGVGGKSAERMAFSLLGFDQTFLDEFSKAISELHKSVHTCPICGLFSEKTSCFVCSDENRDHDTVVVLSSPRDVLSFEKIKGFNGTYHVLGASSSKNRGLAGLDELNINKLVERVTNDKIKEVIIATNPTLEGEATAMYIVKLLKDCDVKITRLGYGMQFGGLVDYTDELTLSRALIGRTNIDKGAA
jgi:recombination protein RecR